MDNIVHESADYDKFELVTFNRKVSKTQALEWSMEKYGFLPSKPLDVSENGNGKFKIRDGHHRYFVARKLKIPVRYVIDNSSVSIRELDDGTHKWTMTNWIEANTREKNPDYLRLNKFCHETGISIKAAIYLFSDEVRGENQRNLFKDGQFKINDKQSIYVKKVGEIVIYMKKCGISFSHNSFIVAALSKIVRVKQLDMKQLFSRIKANVFMFEKQATIDQYLSLFETIYNRHSNPKIPLKFLAEDAVKEEMAIKA